MTDPVFDWPLFLRQLDMREHAWNGRRVTYARSDAVPFMPYPLPRFTGFLMEAVQALRGAACYTSDGHPATPAFLDVGCGPGTKMLLARQMFGLSVAGIDIAPEFIAEARYWELDAEVADAFDYKSYDQFDIVLVNRPSGRQDELEHVIADRMRPGGILIALNWRNDPARWGWHTVSQELGGPIICGVWAKPDGTVHLCGASLDPQAPTACCFKALSALPSEDSLSVDREDVTCRYLGGVVPPVAGQAAGDIPDRAGVGRSEPADNASGAGPVRGQDDGGLTHLPRQDG